ncbi:hypothetical protein GGE17_007635 [Rhizobium leguminosarum]|nr:hypothetical protein [Rhizobium leguminosarum]
MPKPARRPAAGRRTGRKATTFATPLLLLRRNHDDHCPAPGTPASMERQCMIISRADCNDQPPHAGSREASVLATVPERHKRHRTKRSADQNQPTEASKTPHTGKNLIPDLSRCFGNARFCQTPSTASTKSHSCQTTRAFAQSGFNEVRSVNAPRIAN